MKKIMGLLVFIGILVMGTSALCQEIVFDSGAITADGAGIEINGDTVTITQSGVYRLSGTHENGQVVVDVSGNTTVVELVLDGLSLTCGDSAPIYSMDAGETIITLAEGSSNTLRDGESYVYPSVDGDEPDAAIFAKGDLRIRGTGALEVVGTYNNGIGTKDHLVIEGGNIKITAPNHGIRGRDSVTIQGGSFDITAGNDGFQSNNDEDADKGWILLEGGAFAINAAHDGIQAETTLTINGGEYTIQAGGGHSAYASGEESYKGLKATTGIEIAGGNLIIDSLDDGVHSNDVINITGGIFSIASGDDGIHADLRISISEGEIDITDSYEGIESMVVDISGGTIHVVASDDGINMSDSTLENDSRNERWRRGSDENLYLNMSGGWVYIDASVDGVDSNGNLFMSGGTLLVNSAPGGHGPALDYDNGTFTSTGGVLAASGASGMAQAPGGDSTQPAFMVYFDQMMDAGMPLYVLDETGGLVIGYQPKKSYENIVISSPDFVIGQTYSVFSGGVFTAESRDGLVLDGEAADGTKLFELTLSDMTSYVDENGETSSGGRGWGW